MYHLATLHSITERQTDCNIIPTAYHTAHSMIG